MRGTIEEFKIDSYKFTAWFDTGMSVGGEILLDVEDRAGKHLLTRTFYFKDYATSKHHMRAFAKKFSNDSLYRTACLNETTHWAKAANWYERNAEVYCETLLRDGLCKEDALDHEMHRLYTLMEKRVSELETSPAFKEHLDIESKTPDPSISVIDPGIQKAVQLHNRIPGVITRFSCEGLRRGVEIEGWEYGPIWFPGKHMPFAHIIYEEIPEEVAEKLYEYLKDGRLGEYGQYLQKAQSLFPSKNEQFIHALEAFAESFPE